MCVQVHWKADWEAKRKANVKKIVFFRAFGAARLESSTLSVHRPVLRASQHILTSSEASMRSKICQGTILNFDCYDLKYFMII